MVRSFYLKNLATSETRTVTQFHYLNWPEETSQSKDAVCPVLEFRRSVNQTKFLSLL
ncbi:unnamed protein product [Protopolystoma xenopodis]|uniref:Tyrosine-protein phosphatase domain-containing protein n=1 Tax=Protopolystoma xenopodis TaxID=117903 RepID=A0A448X2E4_9PLAT|nr:unnamed protein product [Protopolystoma xenopodis]